MAGQTDWRSAQPDNSGELFHHIYVTGTGLKLSCLGVAAAADLSADRTWVLKFQVPEVLPTGSPKLRIISYSTNTVASAITALLIEWLTGDPSGFDPDGTYNVEGATEITDSTSADVQVETKIALDVATAPAAGETLMVKVIIDDSEHDITSITGLEVDVIWE